jgi:dCMP deaminase
MSWDEFFMRHVYLAATKSRDPRTKIGAILVKDGVIISEGFNGFPRKVKDLPSRYLNKKTKYKMVCHAEHNAVLNACRTGISTLGSICFTNGIPCCECSKALIQAGILEIVVHKQWPEMNQKWKESIKTSKIMFKEAGVKIRIFDEVLGLEGFNNGEIVKV